MFTKTWKYGRMHMMKLDLKKKISIVLTVEKKWRVKNDSMLTY